MANLAAISAWLSVLFVRFIRERSFPWVVCPPVVDTGGQTG